MAQTYPIQIRRTETPDGPHSILNGELFLNNYLQNLYLGTSAGNTLWINGPRGLEFDGATGTPPTVSYRAGHILVGSHKLDIDAGSVTLPDNVGPWVIEVGPDGLLYASPVATPGRFPFIYAEQTGGVWTYTDIRRAIQRPLTGAYREWSAEELGDPDVNWPISTPAGVLAPDSETPIIKMRTFPVGSRYDAMTRKRHA